MTGLELWVMFTLGLVSSLHCVQMCGPIVLSYSVALEQTKPDTSWNPSLFFGHIAYNSGRILTYAGLGAVAGLVGKTVGLVGRLAGVGSALAIVGGVLMLVAGLVMFGVFPGAGRVANRFFRISSSFLRRISRLVSSPKVGQRFLLGMALGLLPCGLLYAAILRALATGSASWGALIMLAFGLGTAGSLFAVGIFSSVIRGRVNRWGTQLAALSVIAMGLLLIVRGTMPGLLMVGGHAAHVHH